MRRLHHERLGLSVRQHANMKTRERAGQGGFERRLDPCSLCGATKKVIRRAENSRARGGATSRRAGQGGQSAGPARMCGGKSAPAILATHLERKPVGEAQDRAEAAIAAGGIAEHGNVRLDAHVLDQPGQLGAHP